MQGTSDVGLSERGRRQAEALGRAVGPRRLLGAYVSPLRRAVETAEIALGGRSVPLRILPDLAELGLGEWEGRTVEEIEGQEGDPYQRWLRAPLDCPPPGSEPLPGVRARVGRAIEEIVRAHRPSAAASEAGEVLVVAHGGVISVHVCHVLGLSLNALWRLRVDLASLTVLAPPRLVSINETAHLRP